MSALTFGALTTDRLDVGSDASIDDLSTLTICVAFYLTTYTTSKNLFGKGGFLTLNTDSTHGTSNIRFFRERATTNTLWRTNDGLITTGKWHFVAVTFDSAATPQVRIYHSTDGGAVAEMAYGTTTAGVGALVTEAADSFQWGNVGFPGGINAIQGDMAYGQLYGRVLSSAEISNIKTTMRPADGCLVYTRMGENGTGTQRNERASHSTGTVTGATLQSTRSYPVNPFRGSRVGGLPALVAGVSDGGIRRDRRRRALAVLLKRGKYV